MNPASNGPASGELSHHGQPRPGERRCVLVIDDDRLTRLALERFLRRNGYEPLGFGTAGDAQTWLQKQSMSDGESRSPHRAANGGIIAGAVIDIHLPDGDGIDLTRSMREHLGDDVPIVIVSADTSIETLRRLKDAGGNRFVGKPMSLAALREALAANPNDETRNQNQ